MTEPSAPPSIAEALGDEGLSKLEAAGERVSFEAGTVIVEPGDPVSHQYLVLSGAVEFSVVLGGDVERLIATVRDGALLGALNVGVVGGWRGRVRACEPTETIRIPIGMLQQVLAADDALALRVLPAVLRQTARQGLIAVENLVATMRWSEKISGLAQVSFGNLISSPDGVTLRLTDGRSLAGRVLRADLETGGGYLALEDGDGALHIVRSSGIVSLERPPVTGPSPTVSEPNN